jgi:N-acetylmuramoyl-L-alanine amidase
VTIPAVVPQEEPKVTPKEEPKAVVNEEPKVVVNEEPQVAPKEEPKVIAPEKPQVAAPVCPVFKVQLLASSFRLKPNDVALKGLTEATYYEEGGMFKYTVGASEDYNEISQLRKSILDKFPQAFIIAFKEGKKMNVNEAIREYKRNKLKK